MLTTDAFAIPVYLYPLTDDALRPDVGLIRAAAQYRATTEEDRWDRWERAESDLAVARVAVGRRIRQEKAA